MSFKNLFLCFSLIGLIYSCSSDSNDDLSPTPNPDPNPNPSGKVTYNGNIKSIMSSFCTSCHGSPTSNGAPMSLTTYAQVVNAVQNRSLIARINSTSNPMPVGGLMSQTNRDLVQQWVTDGLLEN
ncbi:hypothetical protein [Litoribaculum gwangyangense]|uniref:Cytochrome c domain-containing protein n=1 Tax=Litoribaculum gwangyangense TaxID=1130722 RepID=A0ABP9CRX8_9FLAO